jgi:hypothetical protein
MPGEQHGRLAGLDLHRFDGLHQHAIGVLLEAERLLIRAGIGPFDNEDP